MTKQPNLAEAVAHSHPGALHVQLLRDLSPRREQCERELLDMGLPLPLPHRIAWARAHPKAAWWFLAVLDSQDQCRGGFAIQVNHSRSMPGHLLLRTERFGSGMCYPVAEAALDALIALARSNRRVLRLNIELFTPDPAAQCRLADALAAHGLRPVHPPRRYDATIAVDLTPDEPTIFASFRGSVRRKVRVIAKHPLAIRQIDDVALAGRMDRLHIETMVRTGGDCRPLDWRWLIQLSGEFPHLCRLVGLFRTDVQGPAALLAFACAGHHGDHAHYDSAASSRPPDLHVPLGYALAWDLICWAKRHGASWFDFGGVTGDHSDDEARRLAGVSDFKRHFSQTRIPVGGEWVLEPRPLRSSIARAVSTGAAWLSQVRGR